MSTIITERMPQIEVQMRSAFRCYAENSQLLVCFDTAEEAMYSQLVDVFSFIDATIDSLEALKDAKIRRAKEILHGNSYSRRGPSFSPRICIGVPVDVNLPQRIYREDVSLKDIEEIINKLENLREEALDGEAIYYSFSFDDKFNLKLDPIALTKLPVYKVVVKTDNKTSKGSKDGSVKFTIDYDHPEEIDFIEYEENKYLPLYQKPDDSPAGYEYIKILTESFDIYDYYDFGHLVEQNKLYAVNKSTSLLKKVEEVEDWYVCKDCNSLFNMSRSEIEWFTSKGLPKPKRCIDCRRKRREAKFLGPEFTMFGDLN